jgi:hypothetical protein
MPDGHAGDFVHQRLDRQSMVEVTCLPIEDIRVGCLAQEVVDQVRVIIAGARGIIRTQPDRIDRVFLVVGVQIANDEEVFITAAGWVTREPSTRASAAALRV